jgi:hypothetical protein
MKGETTMTRKPSFGLSRRRLFQWTGAAAAATALVGRSAEKSAAHDLKPTDSKYRYDEYEAIVNRRDLTVRQVYEWPNINNPILFSNVRNGLNGFQFSYGIPAESIQVVVQAYGSANGAMYDDYVWETYQIGELLTVTDPETKEPAIRNPWFVSAVEAATVTAVPTDRSHAYYADASIEGLQRRGVLFLI